MIRIKNKILRTGITLAIAGAFIGGATLLYLLNMPQRDVQKAEADFTLNASALVAEYLTNETEANAKYLAADGDSKVLMVSGIIAKISEGFKGQKIVLLQGQEDKAGVSCTFTLETGVHLSDYKLGDIVSIKGVIRSGATYDEDMEMYEHVLLEKSDLIR